LRIQSIRGNIDTRVKKLRAGDFAATILAYAGLIRAGLFDPSLMHPLSLEEMLPAPGQGALALQCRKDDANTRQVLAGLDDPTSRAAVDAERSVVAALNCDCHSPIAVHARIEDQTLHLRALLGQRDGDPPVRSASSDSPLADSAAAIAAVVRKLSA
jgi:hydroxymethylbilane synthase